MRKTVRAFCTLLPFDYHRLAVVGDGFEVSGPYIPTRKGAVRPHHYPSDSLSQVTRRYTSGRSEGQWPDGQGGRWTGRARVSGSRWSRRP